MVHGKLQRKQTFSESSRSLSFGAGPAEYFPARVMVVAMLSLPTPKGDLRYDGARRPYLQILTFGIVFEYLGPIFVQIPAILTSLYTAVAGKEASSRPAPVLLLFFFYFYFLGSS